MHEITSAFIYGDKIMSLLVPVSWGELLDKISILEIKKERIANPEKVKNVSHELVLLSQVRDCDIDGTEEILALCRDLKEVNVSLWDIEDDIRMCEKANDFGEDFVALARAVYKTNDRRAELKYKLNKLLGSDVIEEKSYEEY